jgi:hypothetical protein
MSADDGIEMYPLSPTKGVQHPVRNLWSYARTQSMKEPRVSEFFVLHQFNILRLEQDIMEWQEVHGLGSEKLERQGGSLVKAQLDDLSKLLRAHSKSDAFPPHI